jgi:hypothetical protein
VKNIIFCHYSQYDKIKGTSLNCGNLYHILPQMSAFVLAIENRIMLVATHYATEIVDLDLIKGSVQRDVKGVEIGLKKSVQKSFISEKIIF